MSLTTILLYIFIAVLIYYSALTIWYTILLIASFPAIIKNFKETKYQNIISLLEKNRIVPITVVIPAFNEEKRILNTVYSVMRSHYKNIQIVIVNDGSTDNMMALLRAEFELYEVPKVMKARLKTSKISHYYESARYPNLRVIDKEHGEYNTSADALNAGINDCHTPLMISLDADTLIEPETISRILLNFLSEQHCVVLSGTVYVLNGNEVEQGKIIDPHLPNRFVPAVQAIEYLRSFLFGRLGYNTFGGSLCYPGAFTFFETAVLRDIGGYDVPNHANDSEITLKIHHWMKQHKYPWQ